MGLGFAIVWAGYAVSSWGYCLLKGYDITFLTWINPVSPYQWPKGTIPTIPPTRIWPGKSDIPAKAPTAT